MKYPRIKLIMSLAILAIGLFYLSQLEIESNMEDMLPKDSKSVEASREFAKYFQGDDQVIIMVKPIDTQVDREAYKAEAEGFIDRMGSQLKNEDYIASSLYKIELAQMKAYEWAYLDRGIYQQIESALEQEDMQEIKAILGSIEESENEKEKELNSYIVNEARTHYIMMIKPSIDKDDFINSRMLVYDGLNQHIKQIVSDYKLLDVGLTGGALIQDIEGDLVAFNGFFGTLVITLLLILLIVILFFGGLKLPVLALYPLILGGLIAASGAYLIYGSLNIFSVSFALLLVGLGIDFAVHLIARYQEERDKGNSLVDAVRQSVKSTGKSIIIGAGTTAFAFASFTQAQFKAFEQMGLVSAIGLIALCMMMILLMPALIQVFDKKYVPRKSKASFKWLGRVTTFNRRRPYVMLMIMIGFMIGLFYGVINTEIQSDLSAVYPENIPSAKWTAELKDDFDYDTNTLSVFAQDIDALENIVTQLKAREDILKVQSVLDYLPTGMAYKLSVIHRLNQVLKAMNVKVLDEYDLNVVTYDMLPEAIKANFVGEKGMLRIDIVPKVNIYDEAHYTPLLAAIIEITSQHPVGMATIMNEVTQLVKEDILYICSLCLIVVFVIAWIAFKRLKLAILSVTPLLITLYLTLGILQLFNIEINIFSIAAFPLIIGIAIDSGIHLIHRLNESSDLTLEENVIASGKPILLTGLTTIIGFGSLANINHPGMANLGITVAIGMALSMLLTLTLIPLLLKKSS